MTPKQFYEAKAKGGDAFAKACADAMAAGFVVVDGHISESGTAKVEDAAPAAAASKATKPKAGTAGEAS